MSRSPDSLPHATDLFSESSHAKASRVDDFLFSSFRSRCMPAYVVAVHRSDTHRFSKASEPTIKLIAGIGVEGDAHAGATIQHRSRVAVDPSRPNLRQVHLIHAELIDELCRRRFDLNVGDMGENITTRGLKLLELPRGTRLRIGETAVLEITGLRNPCSQLDTFRPGLKAAVLGQDDQGNLVRKAGVMAIVIVGGTVDPGDEIHVDLPTLPHRPLECV